MKTRKLNIAAVYSSDKLDWGSCRQISENLRSAVGRTNHHILEFPVSARAIAEDRSCQTGYLENWCALLAKKSIDLVMLMDYAPFPGLLLTSLLNGPQNRRPPAICFYVYGNFTLDSPLWQACSPFLTGHRIHFLCASSAHANLIKSLLPDRSSALVHEVPFPLNHESYNFDAGERRQLRKDLGLRDADKAIIYTGRLSPQKNVDLLITQFKRWSEERPEIQKLIVLGSPAEDVGNYYLGYPAFPNWEAHAWKSFLSTVPAETMKKIFLPGPQSKDRVRKYLAASDCFVSLSLHHDEDFGMSPLEALANGLPSVLTNWGGFRSLKREELPCLLTDVKLGGWGFEIDSHDLQSKVFQSLQMPTNKLERQITAGKVRQLYSIDATAETLDGVFQKIMQDPNRFKGFNAHHRKLARASKVNLFPHQDSPYNSIYKPYRGNVK